MSTASKTRRIEWLLSITDQCGEDYHESETPSRTGRDGVNQIAAPAYFFAAAR
jgi:hypothetical protein